MIEIDIRLEVFNEVYRPYLSNMARTQILYGGAASGKSVFLAQRVIFDLLQGKRNYLIARQTNRTIRRSVWNEIHKVISDWNVGHLFEANKSDQIITCVVNERQALFTGLDDPEKVKSITPAKGVLTDIWIEEATETSEQSINQLYLRQRGGSDETPKRLTLSFNPVDQMHWIYERYFAPLGWSDNQQQHNSDSLAILKTWHVHNQFLTDDDRHDLESNRDRYWRDVYARGNWGVLGNVIFTNWTTADLSDMAAQFTNHRHGLDFGFSSDPAAMVVTHFDRKRGIIYIYDELYESGMTNDVLAHAIKERVGNEPVVCDSAEPKSIVELRQHGVTALPASKGRDSVWFGIQKLGQYEIVIDSGCTNTINEFRSYRWKEDQHGRAMRVPVDYNNHAIDALRYAYEVERNSQPAKSRRG